MKQRVICWFSAGAASAVAAWQAKEKYKDDPTKELVVVQIYLKNEHPDSQRFTDEWAEVLGLPIHIIQDEEYGADINTVFERRRYMAGINGASCTTQLKRHVRHSFQREDDIHVFGMTCEESERIEKLEENEEGLLLDPILITNNFTKQDCFHFVTEVKGVTLPAMYQLGYPNNNCIGCVKSGSPTYWNKIRKDFPDEFNRRSKQEQELGISLCTISEKVLSKEFPSYLEEIKKEESQTGKSIRKTRKNGRMRIPLRHLPPTLGEGREIKLNACGLFCDAKEARKALFDDGDDNE